MKTLCVLGCTGQLASHLIDIGLERNCKVVGVKRRSSTNNLWRIAHHLNNVDFEIIEGDITDPFSLHRIFSHYKFDWCVNTAAQSHVHTSFHEPVHTLDVTGRGAVNVLESIRQCSPTTKLVQMSSSEMYGDNIDPDGFQRETTLFSPNSPYSAAKLYAYHMVNLYRECYQLNCCSAIAFNFEGPRRGENFVTRKISQYIGSLTNYGFDKVGKLNLGNLYARRDWSYAGDTAMGIWTLLNSDLCEEFCFASGESYTVKDFVRQAFEHVSLDWENYVNIDERLFRPKEVPVLKGCADKAKNLLGWKPTTSFKELVGIMVESDIDGIQSTIYQ